MCDRCIVTQLSQLFILQIERDRVLGLDIDFKQLELQVRAIGFCVYCVLQEGHRVCKAPIRNIDFGLADDVCSLRGYVFIFGFVNLDRVNGDIIKQIFDGLYVITRCDRKIVFLNRRCLLPAPNDEQPSRNCKDDHKSYAAKDNRVGQHSAGRWWWCGRNRCRRIHLLHLDEPRAEFSQLIVFELNYFVQRLYLTRQVADFYVDFGICAACAVQVFHRDCELVLEFSVGTAVPGPAAAAVVRGEQAKFAVVTVGAG